MTKMKEKKQEAPLKSEMNSEVIDISCNFCSKVFSSKWIVKVHCESQASSPQPTWHSLREVQAGDSLWMWFMFILRVAVPVWEAFVVCPPGVWLHHCIVRERKKRLPETCEFCIFDAMISSLAGITLRWEFILVGFIWGASISVMFVVTSPHESKKSTDIWTITSIFWANPAVKWRLWKGQSWTIYET